VSLTTNTVGLYGVIFELITDKLNGG
jgi:hypothetical protein